MVASEKFKAMASVVYVVGVTKYCRWLLEMIVDDIVDDPNVIAQHLCHLICITGSCNL